MGKFFWLRSFSKLTGSIENDIHELDWLFFVFPHIPPAQYRLLTALCAQYFDRPGRRSIRSRTHIAMSFSMIFSSSGFIGSVIVSSSKCASYCLHQYTISVRWTAIFPLESDQHWDFLPGMNARFPPSLSLQTPHIIIYVGCFCPAL